MRQKSLSGAAQAPHPIDDGNEDARDEEIQWNVGEAPGAKVRRHALHAALSLFHGDGALVRERKQTSEKREKAEKEKLEEE